MPVDVQKHTRLLMGMPITIAIVGKKIPQHVYDQTFAWFEHIDACYSPYKDTSEVSLINDGLPRSQWSPEMRHIYSLCQQTKRETNGYFDVGYGGRFDPSGLVKGWAIQIAAQSLVALGYHDFYIDAGGDIQVFGHNGDDEPWRVGVQHPFQPEAIVKVVALHDQGIATSGSYIRGDHIYNPLPAYGQIAVLTSLTVIGPTVFDADRMATAAYAMGVNGLAFLDRMPGYAAYGIAPDGTATKTRNFRKYVVPT